MKSLFHAWFSIAALTLSASPALASPVGSDNAANYPSMADYQNVNGGLGFNTGFTFGTGSGPTYAGTFLGPSGKIDTGGLAFGLSNNAPAVLLRLFGNHGLYGSDGQSLAPGQTFELTLASSSVTAGGGSFGIDMLRNLSQGTSFQFRYIGGAQNYSYEIHQNTPTGATTTVDTGVPFSPNGVKMSFTRNGVDTVGTFTLGITPVGSTNTTYLTNVFVGGVYAFDVFNNKVATSADPNVFFNNAAVIPEPGSAVILAAGAFVGLCVLRKRRKAV